MENMCVISKTDAKLSESGTVWTICIYREGYVVPIVDLTCQFKQPLSFGEEAIVETRFIHSDAAKILFEYTIYRASDQYIVATGTTTQVFLNTNRELELVNPAFYIEWKKKWNII